MRSFRGAIVAKSIPCCVARFLYLYTAGNSCLRMVSPLARLRSWVPVALVLLVEV
jgi:hypothetical protein